MKKYLFPFSVMLLLLVAACNKPISDSYTQEMDSLLKALDASAKDFESIDYPNFEMKKTKAKNNLITLQSLIKDTLRREDALIISNYARIVGKNKEGKPLDTLSAELMAAKEKKAEEYGKHRQEYVKQELKLCMKQIEDLKHDYSKELMTAEELKKNLQAEATSAKKIIDFVVLEKAAVTSRIALYDSLSPGFERILDSLKSLSKNKP